VSIWNLLATGAFTLTFVDVNGISTRSLQVGSGAPVVFLHGTSSHLEVFTPNLRAFADAGFEAHAIDMLGHGYTDKPDRDLEVSDYVNHVVQYIDANGWDRVNLVGESLGGWVAAWLCSEHSQRVSSLQLVSSGGTLAVPEVMERIRTTTERAVYEDQRTLTYERLAKLFFDPAQLDDDLVEARYRIYHNPDFQRMLPHLLCMQDMDIRQRNLLRPERMARIITPTRIIWGRFNPMGAVLEAQRIHEAIAGSELEIYESCGHFPQLEYPERFNQEAIGFIAKAIGDRRCA
jgi:2-hydroxy-6-oxonona-2,4-dienedioate hydrolase